MKQALNNRRLLRSTIGAAVLMCVFLAFLSPAMAEEKKEDKKPKLPKDAHKALYLAQQAINEKKFNDAAEALNTYLATEPKDVPLIVYMMLGHVYYQMEDLAKARDTYGKGHKAFPDDLDILLNYAVMSYETEQFSQAGALLEKLYRLKEKRDIKLLFQAAVAYYQGEKLRESRRLLTELLGTKGKPDPKWYELIIGINMELEEWGEAEKWIHAFLRQNPSQAKYWRFLAQRRLDKEKYKEAASLLEIAHRIEPPKPREWLDLADLYMYLNAPLMAIRCIKSAHQGKMPVKDKIKISETYARTQRYDLAIQYLDEAYAIEPSARLLFEKGRLLYDAVRYEEAIAVLDECVQMDPKFGEAFMLMGFAAWNLKDWERARTAFSDASQLPKYRQQALEGVAVMDDLIEFGSDSLS